MPIILLSFLGSVVTAIGPNCFLGGWTALVESLVIVRRFIADVRF
jgi:hypothetical protein